MNTSLTTKPLNPKEREFLDEYLSNGNKGTEAAMKVFGLSYESAAVKATRLLKSDKVRNLIDNTIPDNLLREKHLSLLNAHTLDHMVFPLGPKNEKERQEYIDADIANAALKEREYREVEYITDEDIKDMLESVNCKIRKIVHGEQARHVYFWAPDNMAVDRALDKGYKLKGKYAPEKSFNLNMNVDIIPDEKLSALASKLKDVQ